MSQVLRCEQCGGCVVYDAAREVARCLFCDSVALEPTDDAIVPPAEAVPFEIDVSRAQAAFARWARASWWHPRVLRSLAASVAPLWIPAWRFEAQIELHWSGLVAASTKSGHRPRAGVDRGGAQTTIVASLGLSQRELDALQPFEHTEGVPWSAAETSIPSEIPSLSGGSARRLAWATMIEARRQAVSRRERLSRCRGSAIVDADEAKLLMLPVWIGSFRYRDRPWRFVVNAQTGRVYGRAPLDRLKLALVVVLGLVVAGLILLWVGAHPPERPRSCAFAPDPVARGGSTDASRVLSSRLEVD